MKKCSTKYCKNEVPQGRSICNTCRSREYRKKNLIKYSYDTLKQNAKRRDKEFTLTFDEFIDFCYETDYIKGKGRTATSYSIDRKDNNIGYTRNNIRVLTVANNSKKGTKSLQYDWQTKYAKVISIRSPFMSQINLDNPF